MPDLPPQDIERQRRRVLVGRVEDAMGEQRRGEVGDVVELAEDVGDEVDWQRWEGRHGFILFGLEGETEKGGSYMMGERMRVRVGLCVG